jgi:hypothetical protein
MPFQKNICTYDKLNLYAEPTNSVDELHSTIYNIIRKEISRVTCNLHFPFADVLLSFHQFSAFKSTLKVCGTGNFRVRTFFFFLICSKLREKGWIVILRQVIPTSPLSLWYGMFPREDFFGFILIKTWMLNIITNVFDYNPDKCTLNFPWLMSEAESRNV